MNYEGVLIRPPSEANSLIFQVTLGCSDNECTFCPAYKEKRFSVKSKELLFKEIDEASRIYHNTHRIFLADGDVLALNTSYLKEVLIELNQNFPKLKRVSLYASAKNLYHKTIEELKELKQLKMSLIYLGIETGDEKVYQMIKKIGSPQMMIEQCLKAKEAGLKLNTTIILGLGGEQYSKQHAKNTALILNKVRPEQIAALTLMIKENTPLYLDKLSGEFQELTPMEIQRELLNLIQLLDDFKCLFFSNHSSNFIPIEARFPKDKHTLIQELIQVVEHSEKWKLKPEVFRGL